MWTVFLTMKKGRQMPPLAFEILCVSETPRYGNGKSPCICRLRSRALNHGCGWWTMPTNSGRPSVPVMANTKGRFKTKSTSSSGGAAAPHIIMTV